MPSIINNIRYDTESKTAISYVHVAWENKNHYSVIKMLQKSQFLTDIALNIRNKLQKYKLTLRNIATIRQP